MTDEMTEAEIFESLWNKFEPLAKKLFHDTIGFICDEATGQESEHNLLNNLRAAYLSLMQSYDNALDIEEQALNAAIRPNLEDLQAGLTDE